MEPPALLAGVADDEDGAALLELAPPPPPEQPVQFVQDTSVHHHVSDALSFIWVGGVPLSGFIV